MILCQYYWQRLFQLLVGDSIIIGLRVCIGGSEGYTHNFQLQYSSIWWSNIYYCSITIYNTIQHSGIGRFCSSMEWWEPRQQSVLPITAQLFSKYICVDTNIFRWIVLLLLCPGKMSLALGIELITLKHSWRCIHCFIAVFRATYNISLMDNELAKTLHLRSQSRIVRGLEEAIYNYRQ